MTTKKLDVNNLKVGYINAAQTRIHCTGGQHKMQMTTET